MEKTIQALAATSTASSSTSPKPAVDKSEQTRVGRSYFIPAVIGDTFQGASSFTAHSKEATQAFNLTAQQFAPPGTPFLPSPATTSSLQGESPTAPTSAPAPAAQLPQPVIEMPPMEEVLKLLKYVRGEHPHPTDPPLGELTA